MNGVQKIGERSFNNVANWDLISRIHCRNPRPLTYYTQPKTLLLRRTGKERPFPHSERIRERPIKMMNRKENAVQFFVNERERSGAQFFRERIRPWCVDNLSSRITVALHLKHL